jgi:hypothetical protein
MGWRGTLVLLLLVVLAASAFWMSPTPEVELPDGTLLGEPRYLRETTPSPRLLDFDASQVAEMTLGFGDEVVTVARQGDVWRGAADARNLNDFLTTLEKSTILSTVENDSSLAEFGLDVPMRRLRLQTDKGNVQVLVMGDRNPAGTSVYVRANDGPVTIAGALVMWEFDKAFAAITGRKSRL